MGEEKEKKNGFPYTIVRHVVQVIVLLVFLAPLFIAGWGLFGSVVGGDDTIATPASSFPF